MNIDTAPTSVTHTTFRNETAIPSVSSISPEEFYACYQVPGIPLIVTNAVSAWPAFSKWTWEWLIASFGDVQVLLTDSLQGKQQARLADYIAYVLNPDQSQVTNGPLYLKDLNFSGEMCNDYVTPDFIDDWFTKFPLESRPPFRWLFIGPASTGSHLHIDTSGTHAWLTQIHGKKEWVLFPPEDLPESYCDSADAFNPDFEKFTCFSKARCFRGVLHPGQTIFTPCGWRHQVRNLNPSWAITENFFNATNICDVYQRTVFPGMRPQLDIVSQQKAVELQGQRADSTTPSRAALLQAFFQFREKQLLEQLASTRHAQSILQFNNKTP
jgi:hypothetical protein